MSDANFTLIHFQIAINNHDFEYFKYHSQFSNKFTVSNNKYDLLKNYKFTAFLIKTVYTCKPIVRFVSFYTTFSN